MAHSFRVSSIVHLTNKLKRKRLLVPLSLMLLGLGLFPAIAVFGASGPSVDVYSQCANGGGAGPTCSWTNGNLNAANSTYFEGDATPQRLAIDGLTTGDHTIVISYQTTKGAKHAYDFLTDDTYSESWITKADECSSPIANMPSCSTQTPNLLSIPHDPNVPAAYETGSRHFKLFNGTWVGSAGTPTLASGTYSGDSTTTISVTFHTDTSTCADSHKVSGTLSCEVLITFGAHVSSQLNWGTGNSAVNIPGSPYHVALVSLDGASIGSRDNQMQASAIVVTPTVTTQLANASDTVIPLGSSVALGSTIHDQVTVTGSAPTGNVNLSFFKNGTCSGTATATSGNLSLSSGSIDATSFAQGPLTAGSYSFLAHYNGDSHNSAADATCENFTVNPANTSTVTHVLNTSNQDITGTSVPLGSVVHDSETVNGQVGSIAPTGTVSYTFYTSGDCSTGAGTPQTVALGTNSSPTSALGVGSYSFKASYSGDGNYNASTGVCEPFSISKGTLGLTTELHQDNGTVVPVSTSVPLNTTMHDKATASGLVSGFTPTNNVVFTFFSNGTCNGTGTSAGSVALVSSVADPSNSEGPLGAGSYSFQASIAGDSNYNGATSSCEPFSVSKANTTTVTAIYKDGSTTPTTAVNLGDSVHDLATVTTQVGSFTIGGTVTYTFYTSGDCSTGAGTPQTVAVGSPSGSSGALGAGSYSYLAVYNGDGNYNGSTGTCEPLTVSKIPLGLTTEIHNAGDGTVVSGPVALNTTVQDKGIASGIVSNYAPANNVVFTFFNNGTCNGTGSSAGSVVLVSGVAYPSSSEGPLAAGSYSFQASIAGDSNYTGATSSCEPLTVNLADTTTATQVRDAANDDVTGDALPLGSVVHDHATVALQVGSFPITGSVTYHFFSNGTCNGTSTSDETVAVGTDSTPQTMNTAGQYSYLTDYSGNANYNPSTGTCEPFSISKADLGLTTELHQDNGTVVPVNTALPLGTTMHDEGVVSGIVGTIAPTNGVVFTFYPNSTCANTGANAGTIALVGNVANPSNSEGPLGAGSYSFQASIAGDTNYSGATSTCEPFTISKAQLTVTTAVHDPAHNDITNQTVPLATVTHDTATVTGGVTGFPLPDVSFTLTSSYTNDCSQGTGVATDGTDNGAVRSADSAALSAGGYAYNATVASNDNYIGSTSDCEPFNVNKAQLGLTTEIHNAGDKTVVSGPVVLGSTVYDQATASGLVSGFAPTNNVSFTFFNNGTCNGTGTSAGSVALVGGLASPSNSQGPLNAGSYSFEASIAGDAAYNGATSACEPLTVNLANTTTTTKVLGATQQDVTNTALPLGSQVHDDATVSGQVGSIALTGTVTYNFFKNGTCNGTPTSSQTVGLGTDSSTTSALGAGNYSYLAVYNGDGNYNGSTGTCEPFSINQATPTVATVIQDASNNVVTTAVAGATVHDKATVNGATGFDPSGNVTFTFFNNGTCTPTGSPAGTVNVVAGIATPSSSEGPLGAGLYSFLAHYNGDNNYSGADATCEPLTISLATPAIKTTPNPASGLVGVVLSDSASLTGGFNPGGSITFKLYSPSDTTCADPATFSNTVSVSGDGTYSPSAGFTSNAAGTWRWVASYSGDTNNNAVAGGCNDEQVTVKAPVITRTLGFWQTHYTYTSQIFNTTSSDSIWKICSNRTIDNTGTLFGGFYASISKQTTGTKRSALDQARMQLMQQLLAAILNNQAFGSGDPSMFTAAKTAYCGTNQAAILSAESTLDTFNNSGDTTVTTQNTGSADPKTSKDAANLTTWDKLP